MKLEIIIGTIIGAALLVSGAVYLMHKDAGSGTAATIGTLSPSEKEERYEKAPEISTPDGFINTDGKPVTLAELKGKVVLLDILTYSCINCQRTLPYLKAWYEKYKDQGLVIVGLHTPEFSFEKNQANVEEAVQRFGITYPVVLDNDFSTWNAYGNQYWPRKYLIDIDGYIVYDHAGEGNYDETERAIQAALAERSVRQGQAPVADMGIAKPDGAIDGSTLTVGSPETYFGSARNRLLANGRPLAPGPQTLIIPQAISANELYLGGSWTFEDEYAENSSPARIVYTYRAKSVYMVASSDATTTIEVLIDGKPVGKRAGSDIDATTSKGDIRGERLYSLVNDEKYGEHTLEIVIPQGGVKAFTFTFG